VISEEAESRDIMRSRIAKQEQQGDPLYRVGCNREALCVEITRGNRYG
jgi:hypothetical protein